MTTMLAGGLWVSGASPPPIPTQLHPHVCSSPAFVSVHPPVAYHSTLSNSSSFLTNSAAPNRPQPSSSITCKFHAENASPSTSNSRSRTVFFLDVAPLCYKGKKPQPSAFIGWMKLLFESVTLRQPVIAVMDGERGNEYRRDLLPTYKANRNTFVPLTSSMNRQTWKGDDADLREAFPFIRAFLDECHVPIVCVEDAEADDVVASLTDQAVQKGMMVTIASPDKDFKQLLCADVQVVVPLADLERWSFYTYKQYFVQHNCDPGIELGLRCMLGDKADSIPGLAELAPGFGRNTALKLMKKYGSLESLLNAAAIRTVGKPYIQNALTEHAPFLWKNLELLRLRRNIPVCLEEEWWGPRNTSNDSEAFSRLECKLKELQLQRALKDGVRTGSFSDRVIIKSSKYKTKNIKPIGPRKLA